MWPNLLPGELENNFVRKFNKSKCQINFFKNINSNLSALLMPNFNQIIISQELV